MKVDEQDKALAFYIAILGFVPQVDIPMGPITSVMFEETCGNLIQAK